MKSKLATAASLRRTEKTDKNLTSSRSHSICRFRLFRRQKNEDNKENKDLPPAIPFSAFYLVDLAGSEDARHTTSYGAQRLRETLEINASLSTLQQCIVAKARVDAGFKDRVPFRQSALTKALKHVFDPKSETRCETVMLATVSPCLADVASSRNTLRYAQNCRGIVGQSKAPEFDEKVPSTWSNEQLREWLVDNAGVLGVDAAVVAPYETGSQLLATVKEDEFVKRCSLREKCDVDSKKATAVYAKLFQMQVDSRSRRRTEPTDRTSREPCEKTRKKPFHMRIRPGMFVEAFVEGKQGPTEVVVVLARVYKAWPKAEFKTGRWLCATTKRSEGMGAGYEVNLWTQREVRVAGMKAEILVVYDEGTRFYYLHLE